MAKNLQALLSSNETQKKTQYNDRVINIEHASFTPLVFTTSGTMAKEATQFHKALAHKMALKSNTTYSEAISYIRKRLSFAILKSIIIALRGKRKLYIYNTLPIDQINFNMIDEI